MHLNNSPRPAYRELNVFLLVGICTVLIDFLFYRAAIHYFDFNVEIAKGAGFVTGTIFSYIANKLFTFKYNIFPDGSFFRFTGLYTVTMTINIISNSLVLSIIDGLDSIMFIAFLVATLISAGLNFFGMKYFVFRNIS